jgi:predicted aspartyl protease
LLEVLTKTAMGTFHWPLTVLSADGDREETVQALVDTGSTYTSLPASLLGRLSIVPQRRLEFELANGEIIEQEIGEARLRVEGIEATRIVVFGPENAPSLMGADTLEGVTMVVDPVGRRLAPTRALLMREES